MECVRLDEHALNIQLAKQLPEHRPLMIVAGGVAGLADRQAEGGRIQRDLSNERGTPAGGGLDRTPQGLAC
jgi:hypothetical protein